MQFSITQLATLAMSFGISQAAPALGVPNAPSVIDKRAAMPASKGYVVLPAPKQVLAGQPFDGGMQTFDRGIKCLGQSEGGKLDAVFIIQPGGSLSNVIIGANQKEGVHCVGGCTLTNVWWADVCEDALTVQNSQTASQTTKIIGGGAFGASDKTFQHNGAGTVSISGFTVGTFGKLLRSCGNCVTQYKRTFILDNIIATGGSELVAINSNYGDTAKLTRITASNVKDICTTYAGTTTNSVDPPRLSKGPGANCLYALSDITWA